VRLCQASAERFEQCAEFPLLKSRPSCARHDGIAHSACQEGRRYRLRRRAIDSGPFSSLVTGKASRSWSALRTAGLSEIARVVGVSSACGSLERRLDEGASSPLIIHVFDVAD
jgi:hypothetical protein